MSKLNTLPKPNKAFAIVAKMVADRYYAAGDRAVLIQPGEWCDTDFVKIMPTHTLDDILAHCNVMTFATKKLAQAKIAKGMGVSPTGKTTGEYEIIPLVEKPVLVYRGWVKA